MYHKNMLLYKPRLSYRMISYVTEFVNYTCTERAKRIYFALIPEIKIFIEYGLCPHVCWTITKKMPKYKYYLIQNLYVSDIDIKIQFQKFKSLKRLTIDYITWIVNGTLHSGTHHQYSLFDYTRLILPKILYLNIRFLTFQPKVPNLRVLKISETCLVKDIYKMYPNLEVIAYYIKSNSFNLSEFDCFDRLKKLSLTCISVKKFIANTNKKYRKISFSCLDLKIAFDIKISIKEIKDIHYIKDGTSNYINIQNMIENISDLEKITFKDDIYSDSEIFVIRDKKIINRKCKKRYYDIYNKL